MIGVNEMIKKKKKQKTFQYFIAYMANGDRGVIASNQIVELEQPINSGEIIQQVQDKLKLQNGFNSLTIINFILLGK